jgi:hypothetical protein
VAYNDVLLWVGSTGSVYTLPMHRIAGLYGARFKAQVLGFNTQVLGFNTQVLKDVGGSHACCWPGLNKHFCDLITRCLSSVCSHPGVMTSHR